MSGPDAPLPEAPTSPPAPTTADAALALLLERARGDPALAAQTSAYLAKQGDMLDLQMENLHEQRVITLNHLKRQELSDRLKLTLQVLTVITGAAVVLFLAAAVWDASRSNALVIEPISTPQDMAAQGLTPTAASARLLDTLRAMQTRTDSARAPNTYRGNWGDDIKVEIPQTGVSLGELFRLMRRWLGHDTFISGEIYRTPRGVALTSRVGDQPGRTYVSADGDLDQPMQKAAEAVYAATQPYRYAVFLSQSRRTDEAIAVLRQLSKRAVGSERAWALIGLGGQIGSMGDLRRASALTREGLSLDPHLAAGWAILSGIEQSLGHDEGLLMAARETARRVREPRRGEITERAAVQTLADARATTFELKGDYAHAAEVRAQVSNRPGYQFLGSTATAQEAIDRILTHRAVNPRLVSLDPDDVDSPIYRARLIAAAAISRDDWRGVADALEKVQVDANPEPGVAYRAQMWPTQVWPWQAYAYARAGRRDEAVTLIARTPLDCYLCLRARAWIAADAGDARTTDVWFKRAIRAAPSLPFAYGEWGRVLAKRGDRAASERQFRWARKHGPRWPEPLVWWGDSLAAAGHKAEARPRYAAAAELAPEWRFAGRLR